MKNPPIILIIACAVFAAVVLGAFLIPKGVFASGMQNAGVERPVTHEDAQAWAEARAAGTPAAYRVYLAAFPQGAFVSDAQQALGEDTAPQTQAEAQRPAAVHVVSTPVQRGPTRAQIEASCQSFVDANWPAPSRLTRIGVGAAGGCAAGALAGGNDTRNCLIGAVAGGGVGEVTVRTRENRRAREYSACVSNGGPPR